jgi:hypothetical protein
MEENCGGVQGINWVLELRRERETVKGHENA